MDCFMQEKKLFAAIISAFVVSMMMFVTIGTTTVIFASAQQQPTNATGTAEHTINKIAVIDPRTGDHRELDLPAANPFVQWITSDSNGNIWLAEQRGNALASVTPVENLSQSNLVAAERS